MGMMTDLLKSENDLEISRLLLDWYEANKRELPWRKTNDPYLIWISEIILQQTRVAQGLSYFLRFVDRFPEVRDLAEAEEDEVLKYWQGLGYYSRARNLHAAAKMIMCDFGGVFPTNYQDVLSLKGIGEYTAAAIVSFAWNQPYPVVDGNVFRVLARLFAIDVPIDTTKGKKLFTELAGTIMDRQHAGLHNQAIMELGALQCVPQNPDCDACPLLTKCLAYSEGRMSDFPVKRNKTKVRNRYFHYFYIKYEEMTWLHRRESRDIWKGLYEFPLIETESPMDFAEVCKTNDFQTLFKDAGSLQVKVGLINQKHVLSHQILYASFYEITPEKRPRALEKYLCIPYDHLKQFAVPRLIHIYLEKLNVNL